MRPQSQRLTMLGCDTGILIAAYAINNTVVSIVSLIFVLPSGYRLIRGYLKHHNIYGEWL